MIMRLLTSLILPAYANPNCAIDLVVERDRDGVYFDRTVLAADVDRNAIFTHLINSVEPGRPILIFDTNPTPALWAESNIVTPALDRRFAGVGYDDLGPADRDELFADFVARADRTLRETARPVLIIDHHFESNLLAKTSTTPLILDFLKWLNEQRASPARDRVRAAFAHGFAIRDHADADIVLANVITRLAEEPSPALRFDGLARAIALYNDHVVLPASARDRAAALIGHAIFEAFEHHVAPRPGGYRVTLDLATRALGLIDQRSTWLAGAADPIDAFLNDPHVIEPAAEVGLSDVLNFVRVEQREVREWRAEFANAVKRGAVRRVGRALVVDLPARGPKSASGLAILRFVRELDLAGDARALVLITRASDEGVVSTHVKLRALNEDTNLDPLITAIIQRGQGGGGRGRAGGLYGGAGRVVSAAELARDLAWVIDRI